MVTLPELNDLILTFNKLLDFAFLWGGLFIILQYPFRFFAKGMNKVDKENKADPTENRGWELLSQTFILFLVAVIVGLLWVVPELIIYRWPDFLLLIPLSRATLFRWALVCLGVTFFAYVYGHEFGEKRWLNSCLGHTALIFFSLLLDGWMGFIFICVPVLLVYYSTLFRLAMVTLPTSNPEEPKERWKRFIIFASYAWGIQFPITVIDGHAWKKPETRIHGDFTWDYPVPGLIWAQSHQVVGITSGTKFQRVAGPGLIFTGQMERAEQVFDLRRQLRTNEINVVTEDGISLKVIVFTGFRIDHEEWPDELYKQLRSSNPLLRGAQVPINNGGSFPYSPQRVQASMGITSSKAGVPDLTIYWDQWAMNVVEDQTRKVIAQKKLDELWRLPEGQEKKISNALDPIAREIKTLAEPILRTAGILLFVARVVNFSFPTEKDQVEITKQQIATWGSEWEGKRSNIMAEAQAEAENAKQKARLEAAAQMLHAITEGIQMTQEVSPNLPPHITAMLFSALLEYIDKSPDEVTSEEEQHYIEETQEGLGHHPEKKL